ncbi:superoxide dismutase [Candidatus Babeliales bacterium]|nr:superoxide dismutase [Candidatus Babeliales bacterium]
MFKLPQLPYAYDALMPYIDAKTMEIHLIKHHQAYIDNLNKALQPFPDLQNYSLDDLLKNLKALPESIQTVVQNNAGGHFNHSLFWEMMTPKSKMVQGSLHSEILKKYNSIESFQEQFGNAAKTRFGSGWAWLVLNSKGDFEIYSTANQDAVIMKNDVPLLGLDVWEHAYYLQYQNRRPDYIIAWWSVVNWEFAEEHYKKAIGK